MISLTRSEQSFNGKGEAVQRQLVQFDKLSDNQYNVNTHMLVFTCCVKCFHVWKLVLKKFIFQT